jgi:hypothetical protein
VSGETFQPAVSDRRRAPRFQPSELSVPVAVAGARLLSIGAYGLMIEAPIPVPAESNLRFHLLVGGEKGLVDGRVRGCHLRSQAPRRLWGVGVEFGAMRPEDRERLCRALVPRNGAPA